MDNTQIPSFEIPKSTEKVLKFEGGMEAIDSHSPEVSKEILPAPAPVQSTTAVPVLGDPQAAAAIVSNATTLVTVQADDTHIIADDVDVIEKEWVDRAKKIIRLTSDDPFVETKEISKLKASYLKKRFDKDIPLPHDGVK
jgi:hypothetical protein